MAVVMRILSGLLIWAVGFNAIYAAHGLGCGLGWGEPLLIGPFTRLNAVLVPLWVAFLALGLLPLHQALRARGTAAEPALRRAWLVGGWAGLGGLAVTGAPVLLPAHCL
ncbi:hypothetical protein ABIE41_003028 [Bosea sp. OAE506]|uniref:hypothetical protein n=1 Tax=Bosea sp. OAE506 TaxID=2663870 RepID=UPI00178B9F34